ncbi:MAG: Hvo_1808 family surface protein [Haloarculaceae archaeon]
MRRTALLALVGALLLAGCGGTFGAATDNPDTATAGPDAPGTATGTPVESGSDGTENGTEMADQPRPDPETDRMGWENGYWYNDPLPVENTANLTAEQREAVIARSMARVERVRDLEFNSTVTVSVRSRANASIGGGERSDALREFDNAKFEAAFLIGEDEDSLSVQQQSRNQTVGGYYDSEADAIVVVSDAETPTLDGEGTLAHELTHAIQDQRLNLSVQRRVDTRDGYSGVLGLVEGEANAVQQAYTARCGEEWTCLSPPDSGEESDPSPPPNWGTYFLQFFPYSDGPDFIASLRDGDDWSRVSAAYENPPRSAQAVIEPGDYGSFEVEAVELRDRTDGSWERVRPPDRPDYGRLGRSGLGAMFARTLYDDSNRTSLVAAQDWLNLEGGEVNRTDPLNYDLAITRGWTGDRLHVYRNGDDLAYVWRLAWESPTDAQRFADAYRRLLSYWGGDRVSEGVWVVEDGPFADAFRVTVDGSRVTVTNAPTRGELDEVRAP